MNIESKNCKLSYDSNESKSGVCPICGHKGLDYGDTDTRDDTLITDWECPDCNSYGVENDKKVFDGYTVQHVSERAPQ